MIKNNEKIDVDLDNLRFVYLGRKTKAIINKKGEKCTQHTHNGISCVGYMPTEIDGKTFLVMGFSFCSPMDHFSRVKARTVISNRIDAGKNLIIEVGKMPTYEQTVGLVKGILASSVPANADMQHIVYTDDCPKVGGVKLPKWFDSTAL